jgi:hypothetical protein
VTPTLDRYWAIGVGDVGGAVVVTTGLDVHTLE